MKIQSYRFLTLIFALLAAISLRGEGQIKRYYTFDRIEALYPWLTSGNAAGLIKKDFSDFSQVRAGLQSISGLYKNLDDPEKNLNISLNTRSFVNRGNFFFKGAFEFSHFERSNQAWSGTISPRSVINMMTDSIPGRVLGESYIMTGEMGYKISEIFAAGVGLNYENSSAAKRTDGRNRNILSAIEIKPAVVFTLGGFTVGANFIYKYGAERVDYLFLGDPTGKNIYNFQGSWMYIKEGITNTIVLDRGYFSDFYGGAVQASFDSERFNFYSELEVKYSGENDYDGNNLLRRYALSEGLDYTYKGKISYNSDNSRHLLFVDLKSGERLSYKIENQYEPVPDEANTWNWFEYGKTLRFYDKERNLRASYIFETGGDRWNPLWKISLSGSLIKYSSEFIVYPARYYQDYSIGGAELLVSRHLNIGRKAMIDIYLNGGAYKGTGDVLSVENPLSTGVLHLADNLMTEDFLFKTSGRVAFGGGFSYRRVFNEKKGTTLFIDAGLRRFQRKGLSRNILSVNLGVNF